MKEYDSKNRVDDEDELTVKQLLDGLERLDQWHSVSTPNLQWFQQNVEAEKKRIRTKQWKDLLAFITVAVFVLSVVMTVVYRQPILILYFQLVGVLLLPLAFKNLERRSVVNGLKQTK